MPEPKDELDQSFIDFFEEAGFNVVVFDEESPIWDEKEGIWRYPTPPKDGKSKA